MTSRERFLAALHGAEPDRTPLAHVAAMTTVELQRMTGCSMPEAHRDPEQLVALCGANHDVFGFDAVTFIINFFNEPAALGAEMDWGAPDVLPNYRSHPWQRAEDAVIPPALLDHPVLRGNLRAIRLAKERYGGKCAVLGKVMGPFSMVQVMHGVDATLMGLLTAPELMAHFMAVSVQALAESANAQLDAGADAIVIGEGGAGAAMVSPELYDVFIREPHRQMCARIGGPAVMHMCGDISPRLDALRQVGFTCFNFDWAIAPSKMKAASRGAFTLIGNVNTAHLLEGPEEEVERQVHENLEAGIGIISPGCAISPRCPNAHLLAMRRAIDTWSPSP